MRVFSSAAETVSLFEELEHTVDLLTRVQSFPELSAVLKLYVISWISLSDLLARLLNDTLDLGIAELDVKFDAIIRNEHVRRSGVPEIVKKYAKAIQYNHFRKLRNNIVHRGKLDDIELATIRIDWFRTAAKANVLRDVEWAANVALTETNVAERAQALIAKRQAEYREHLGVTFSFLNEIALVIVPIVTGRAL
ncbi:MAG: hypothetical protein QOK37_2437 [Thermoanaerobaculia bacterium]|nr:hypothetical protein [Thermoanaerobaculia bacterium]